MPFLSCFIFRFFSSYCILPGLSITGIIRPAYKYVGAHRSYTPLDQR